MSVVDFGISWIAQGVNIITVTNSLEKISATSLVNVSVRA